MAVSNRARVRPDLAEAGESLTGLPNRCLTPATEEGLGTFWVASFQLPGGRAEFFGVYTEFVPNRRIVEKYSLAFEGTWTHTFDPEGSGTRVTVHRHPRSFWRLGLFDKLASSALAKVAD